jgi:hypothetical protein
VRNRLGAVSIGLCGTASALIIFSGLERAASRPLAYLAVPFAGVFAVFFAARLVRILLRGGESV